MSIFIPKITDIIDIIIVAFILYRVFILLTKSGGYQMLFGLLAVFIIYLTASLLKLNMMTSILTVFKEYWIIIFIVLFQYEIRNLFARIAQTHDMKTLFKSAKKSFYSPLLNAVSIMSFRKIGALIIIENKRKLDNYIESGEIIDAQISVKLLLTIFNNKTILHDGAVIVRNERLYAVKVVLPLSESVEYSQKLGTRHLAGVGITESTDAFAIIVSEETGKISVAKNGVLYSELTIDELSQRIKDETS
ncbi:MAG: diadenylate cyclase CdaA [Candidatus Cloacimonadota bacterium]|nr:diadenylate cyclase CdaA [Candidatus Cloacimonadota bacterium]